MKFGKTPNVEPEKSSDYSFVCFWFLPSLPQKGFFTQYTNHKDIQKMPSEVAERAHQYRKRLPTTKLRLRPPGLLCPVATASTRHAHPHTHSTLAFAARRPLVALPQQHRKQQHPSLRVRAQCSLPLPIPRSREGTRNRVLAPLGRIQPHRTQLCCFKRQVQPFESRFRHRTKSKGNGRS